MASLREDIASAMKDALKAKDQAALATMRLISAALKDRDIAARGNGNHDGIADDEILSLMQTMIKRHMGKHTRVVFHNDSRARAFVRGGGREREMWHQRGVPRR